MTLREINSQCRRPGCVKNAKEGGFCHGCRTAWDGRQTTDHVHTGRKPKLTPGQVAEARRMRAAFKSNIEIAKHFGVHVATLRRYLNAEATTS